MSKLSLLDLAFFVAESEASPKHVAGLLILKRPARSSVNFAHDLYEEYLTKNQIKAPFNKVIKFTLTGMPYWKDCKSIDMSQHIFYHKLEKGQNSRKDLYQLVSQLHEPRLDRSRPLWEVHVIDGLENGRFGLYQKMHHACADGITMMRWTAENMHDTPDEDELHPIWTVAHGSKRRSDASMLSLKLLSSMWSNVGSVRKQAVGVARLATMMFLESVKLTKNAISLPFVASRHTPLTGQVTAGRQFATVTVPMDRINRIRNITRSTLNHVALTCLDGALHRYLKEQGIELKQPITIQMPVNLRAEGEKSSGNKIGIIQVELSAPTDDPYVRLRNIGFSLRNVRSMMDSVVPEAIEYYTLITGLFGQITEMLHLSNQLPPLGNTLVSNVPGPTKPLYLKGAKLEELHPISTLPPSNLLNITLFSYVNELTFGLVATDELPNLERLADFIEQAFDELEHSVQAVPRLLPPVASSKPVESESAA